MIAVKGVYFAFDAQGNVHSPAGAHHTLCSLYDLQLAYLNVNDFDTRRFPATTLHALKPRRRRSFAILAMRTSAQIAKTAFAKRRNR